MAAVYDKNSPIMEMALSLIPSPTRVGRRLARALLLLAGLGGVLPALADDTSAFSLQGFGTVGAARTTSKDVAFVRDLSQPDGIGNDWSAKVDSVLGVQAAWRITHEFEAVVQGMSRYGSAGNFRPEIAWAFAKYDPAPNLSLRAGRLGTEFFMLADSRWVGYSFLTVRPPGDFFWYLPFYSIHGADVAYTVSLGDSLIRTKAFYGLSNGKIPLADQQWDIEGSPMTGVYVEYQAGAWQVRGSYANIRFENDLPLAANLKQTLNYDLRPAQAAFLSTRNKLTHYYSLGVLYDRGPWQAQLMLNHINQGSKVLENSSGGYGLLGYRVGQVTPFIGYSWIRSSEKDRLVTGDPLADAITDYVMKDSHSDQKTTFAGLRWDVLRNVAVKAQWDGIRGDESSYFPYRKEDRARWNGKLDVFSLTVDFIF